MNKMKSMFEQPARPDLATNAVVKSQLRELEAEIDENGLCGEHLTHRLPMIFGATEDHVRVALFTTAAVWKEIIRLAPGDSKSDSKLAPLAVLVRFYIEWPQYWPVAQIPDMTENDIETIGEAMKSTWLEGGNLGHISLLTGRSTSRAYSWKRNPNTTSTPVTPLVAFLRYLAGLPSQAAALKKFKRYVSLAKSEARSRGISNLLDQSDWDSNNEK